MVERPPSFQMSVLYWLEKRFHKGVGMESECCSMLVDSIVDNLINVRDMEISMEGMIGNIPRRICYGMEQFRLVSLQNCYIGFGCAAP